jgi:glycerol kinase
MTALSAADGESFTPSMAEEDRARLLAGWDKAVEACRVFRS